jgi:drug/metabolite transporter (DMT)-like permease
MKRPLPFVLGVIIALAGIVFTLQGIGVLSGSSMSNTATWSILGPIITVIGGWLVYRGTRPLADRADVTARR